MVSGRIGRIGRGLMQVQLVGLLLVRDEVDVVADHLHHALAMCDVIGVLDNGSTDGTAEVVADLANRFPGRIVNFGVDQQPYRRDLRRVMYDDLRGRFSERDWFLQLDADEFLVEDPRPALELATRQGFDRVRVWQAQFHFTELDLQRWEAGDEDPSESIRFRRRHYLVDWREDRFWRNRPQQEWTGEHENLPRFAQSVAPWALLNRHYPLRTPEQIQRRLDLRASVRNAQAFCHVTATDWRSEVTPADRLRYWTHDDLTPTPRAWRYYVKRAKSLVG